MEGLKDVWDDISIFDFPVLKNFKDETELSKFRDKLIGLTGYLARHIQHRAVFANEKDRAYANYKFFIKNDSLSGETKVKCYDKYLIAKKSYDELSDQIDMIIRSIDVGVCIMESLKGGIA